MKLINKRLMLSLIAIALFASGVSGQMMDPVKWKSSVKKINDTEAELIMTATMEEGWHLYSQFIKEGGPVATEYTFKPNDNYEVVGKVIEPKPIEENDPNFNMVLKYFGDKATFKQKIKIKTDKAFKIDGEVYFMCCDDKQCLPPNVVEFVFNIPAAEKTTQTNTEEPKDEVAENETEEPKEDVIEDEKKDTINAHAQAEIADNSSKNEKTNDADDEGIKTEKEKYDDMSLWLFFFTALGLGFAAVLTPCIYPMIPMTVSYFMHDTEKKKKKSPVVKALIFGISIILIYVLFGSVISLTLGERFGNIMATHWIPNVFFFMLFIIFAASFLGMFEITLPSWLINRTDKQADKGGYGGAFFMALTLVIVSFSCTAPIAGIIIGLAVDGQVLKPIVGMLGYSLAFAIPFTIFAIIPGWMQKLPKSGGWLNAVKVVIGFIELALAFKFLSVADQTYHWGILDREIYIALWIVIFSLMGMYLLGKIKFSHDSDMKYLGVPRLGLVIVTFAFVVYLIPGMFGAPLKALAGWLPPQGTHDFDIEYIIKDNAYMVKDAIEEGGIVAVGNSKTKLCEEPKYADALHLPHHLKGYFDIDQAMACAKAQGKPVFIDFTGHGCVNCREMEAVVWSAKPVLKKLQEEYVVVALYVDDHKIKLPEEDWVTSTYDGKVKKTLGAKNWDFQKSKFNANAQPFYCLIGDDGELLVEPRGYDKDVDEFVKFLDKGVENYKKKFNK